MAKGKYLYKNIICFQYYGTWQADYKEPKGKRFPLHRHCNGTKAEAYALAKQEVDYMNERGATNE